MGDFYVLVSRPDPGQSSYRTDFLDVELGGNAGPAPKCPRCGRFTGPMTWRPPYAVELEMHGDGYGDLAFGPVRGLLVSERFGCLFKNSGLSGLEGFDEVEVVKISFRRPLASPPPKYLYANVAPTNSALDEERSNVRRLPPEVCPVCRIGGTLQGVERVVIEQATWSGEDIFVPRGLPGTLVVTGAFKRFCEKHNISNAAIIHADRYGFDFYVSAPE